MSRHHNDMGFGNRQSLGGMFFSELKRHFSRLTFGGLSRVPGLGSLFTVVIVAVLGLCMAVPAHATDKLIVKDASNNTTFVVTDTGQVGIGTAVPNANLQVGTVTPPNIGTPWDYYSYDSSFGRMGIDSGVNNAGLEFLESGVRKWFIGSFSGLFGVYDTPSKAFRMVINSSGNVGIGTTNPTHPLVVGTSNTNGNGAYLSAGGVWENGCSREFKENIKDLSAASAIETVKHLNPVTYAYKVDPSEKHVGFIAEDVPALVATKDRKHLSALDIVAVLTKVVQEQQKTINELSQRLNQLQNKVNAKGVVALDTK
jgi:Chaperone of endosialidase